MYAQRASVCVLVTLCKRHFPWLSNYASLRCHSCETMVVFVTRALLETGTQRRVTTDPAPSGSEPESARAEQPLQESDIDSDSELILSEREKRELKELKAQRCKCTSCGGLVRGDKIVRYPEALGPDVGFCDDCDPFSGDEEEMLESMSRLSRGGAGPSRDEQFFYDYAAERDDESQFVKPWEYYSDDSD